MDVVLLEKPRQGIYGNEQVEASRRIKQMTGYFESGILIALLKSTIVTRNTN